MDPFLSLTCSRFALNGRLEEEMKKKKKKKEKENKIDCCSLATCLGWIIGFVVVVVVGIVATD